MADAAGHKFGQDLGTFLEDVVLTDILRPKLLEFTNELGYYLDYQKPRRARPGKKVIWKDKYGNDHSLDFVIEAGGTEVSLGRPVAFIESAWRRYTKHSKNKAQEIQGAVLPIVEKFRLQAPFVGVVLAGEFTAPSLQQLRSLGFSVIYIPYNIIVDSFAALSIDIAFDEQTPDVDYRRASQQIAALSTADVAQIRSTIAAACAGDINSFMSRLEAVLRRHIVAITLVPAWGDSCTAGSVAEARELLVALDVSTPRGVFLRCELTVRYSNGDLIRAEFAERDGVADFLSMIEQR